MQNKSVKVDPEVMEKLLAEPTVKAVTDQMKPETLEFYKELLVTQGIYAAYAKGKK